MAIIKLTARDTDWVWHVRNEAILAGCAQVYDAKSLAIWTPDEVPIGFSELVTTGFYGIKIDNEIAAVGMLDEHTRKIEGLFVLPEFMGRGVGKQLLSYLERLALEHRINELHLDASLNAEAFYQRCGYQSVRRETYHSPSGISLPSVLMRKRLR